MRRQPGLISEAKIDEVLARLDAHEPYPDTMGIPSWVKSKPAFLHRFVEGCLSGMGEASEEKGMTSETMHDRIVTSIMALPTFNVGKGYYAHVRRGEVLKTIEAQMP